MSAWDKIVEEKIKKLQPARKVGGARIAPKRQRDTGTLNLQEMVERRGGWEEKWSLLANVELDRVEMRIEEFCYVFRRLALDYLARWLQHEIRAVVHSSVMNHFTRIRGKLFHIWLDDIRHFSLEMRIRMARNIFLLDYALTINTSLAFPEVFAREHGLFFPRPPHDMNIHCSSLQDIVIFGFEALGKQWPLLTITNDLRHYVRSLHIRLCHLGSRNFRVSETLPGTNQRIMDYEVFLDQNTPSHIRCASKDFFSFHHSVFLGIQKCFAIFDRLETNCRAKRVPPIPDATRHSAFRWVMSALEGTDGRTIHGVFKDKFYQFFERPGMFDLYLQRMIDDEQVVGTDLPPISDNYYSAYNSAYPVDASVIQKVIMEKTPIEVMKLSNEPFCKEAQLLYFLCAAFHVLYIQTRINSWKDRFFDRPRGADVFSQPVTLNRVMREFFVADTEARVVYHTDDPICAIYTYINTLHKRETNPEIRDRIDGLRICMFEDGSYQRKAVKKVYDPYEGFDPHIRNLIL